MSRPVPPKDLSLRSLELFQICATKGSLQATAEETGLSISTVSHHLRNLEDHLRVDLFDHSRRPMALTQKGRAFLRNIDVALLTIRKAKAELSGSSAAEARYLRFGSIEDFDSDIVPMLAVFLSKTMPSCDFLYQTDTSHIIIEQLRNHQLDLGISSAPSEGLGDLQDRPLLRDPFVVVLPATITDPLTDIVEGRSALPFLRFSNTLMIGRQIEQQLRRMGLTSPHRFECSNHQTLMAMVAAGAGWTITTPLLFSRAKRFQPKLQMHPFPGKSFARTLSIISTPDCAKSVFDLVDSQMRALINDLVLAPSHDAVPWLKDRFALIP